MVPPGRSQLPDAPAPGLFQVISLGGDSSNAQQTREYKRRRPHKKSRGGCTACKQRRVKCDQALPSCLRCRRNQRTCIYEHLPEGAAAAAAAAAAASSSTSASASASASASTSASVSVSTPTSTSTSVPVSVPGSSPGSASGSGSGLGSGSGPTSVPVDGSSHVSPMVSPSMHSLVDHTVRAWAKQARRIGLPSRTAPAAVVVPNVSVPVDGHAIQEIFDDDQDIQEFQPVQDMYDDPDQSTVMSSRSNFRILPPNPFPFNTNRELGTPSGMLLHHLYTVPTSVFSMPNYAGDLLRSGLVFPHLQSTLLAAAAAHLCHFVPGTASRDHRIAEHYQQSLALQAYQKALMTPLTTQGQAGVDALLLTAMITNMLAFILPNEDTDSIMVCHDSVESGRGGLGGGNGTGLHSRTIRTAGIGRGSWADNTGTLWTDNDPDPRRSWVFSPHPNRLGWLAVMTGLTPLLAATAAWREKSFLAPLYANSDDERRIITGTWQSMQRVPQAWLDLFGIDRNTTPRIIHNPTDRNLPPKATPPTPPPPAQVKAGRRRGQSRGANSQNSGGSGGSGGNATPNRPGASPGGRSTSSQTSTSTSSSKGSGRGSVDSGGSVDATVTSEADRLYRAPLRILAELWQVPVTGRTLSEYFQFPGKLEPEFRQRLFVRDEKTLWLFGMWMGLLCRFDNVWWVRRRARCDFRAVRLWLHFVGVARRPGAEGQLWQSLLRDLDRTWNYDFEADEMMHRS